MARPLPERGTVVIGRGLACDLSVDHPSVSRKHAILHVGPELRIQDVGSANGIRIGGRAVPSGATVAFAASELVELGSAVLTVQGHRSVLQATDDAAGTMGEVEQLIKLVSRGDISVLLLGETGVGKEVIAEKIHGSSRRADGPFVRINCAALSEQLLESELFGHERGAFTGASATKQGLLEAAEGGTFFLDEVGELPMTMQAKLLRVLEARQVTRVGALRPRSIDVRFVSATNRDLVELCRARTFREDLFYRLNGISVTVPPLRERRAEVAAFARLFVARACASLGKNELTIAADALALLEEHRWPGNVRELRNVMERAVLLCTSGSIGPEHLRLEAASVGLPGQSDLRTSLADTERTRIVSALAEHGGNQTRAAQALGISRRTLLTRMDVHGLPRPRKPTC